MNNSVLSLVFFLCLFSSIHLICQVVMQSMLFTKTGESKIAAWAIFWPSSLWSAFYYLILINK
jgi:hypothetical protein